MKNNEAYSVVSHPSLVAVAAKWLQKKHAVVITELATTGEEPDAIGWCGTHSTLVECKISRADFNADKGKKFRREPRYGVGQYRYFLTVPGIIKDYELPEKWGLLELTGERVRMVRESEHFSEVNHRHEIGILLSTLRRIGHNAPKGTSIKHYTIETKNRATVGTARMANDQVVLQSIHAEAIKDLDSLKQQLAEAKKDSERLDWLDTFTPDLLAMCAGGASVRQSIDAAIREGK